MADSYPQLQVDRDVTVLRNAEPELAPLRVWLDAYDGPMPCYRAELVVRVGNYTCPYTATGPDAFEALVRLRRQLEPDGLSVAVQGARRHTYPSPMARDMGGGMKVYVMRLGVPGRPDLVETFDDAEPEQLGTVEEQRAFFLQWIDDLPNRR